MQDNKKTQKQLIKELTKLRQRIAELEASGRKRNQFEETLRIERDKAQQYLDIAEVILVALNKKGEITLINRKGNQILGYKEGKLLGKNWFTTCVPSRLRKKTKGRFLELMAGEIKLTEFYENPVLTKSGTERIIAWHNNFLKDTQGNLLGTLSSGENITDRKQAEEALRKSEDKYRTILENIEDGYYEVDLAGNFTFLNDAMCRIWGYPKEELMGVNNRQYTDKENAKRVFQAFNEVYRTGKPGKGYDYEIRKKDGTRAFVETSISLQKDSSGKAIGFRGIIRDITERKRAEAEVRESQQRFQGLVETLSDWIWEVDQNGLYTYVSPRVRDLLGYEPQEILGKTPFDLMPPEEAQRIKSTFESLVAVQQPLVALENTCRHKDGRLVVFETSGMPVFQSDGQFKGYRGVDRDITERKQTEVALKERQETINAIIETSQDWIWAIDSQGVHTYSNPAIEKILGYRTEEIVGGQSLDLMHEDDKKMVESMLQECEEKRCGWNNLLLRWRHKDGTYRYLESNAVPILDTKGDLAGFRGVDRDITERTRAGRALEESEKKYRQVVENATDIIYTTDINGNFKYANSIGLKVTGYSLDELQQFNYLDLVLSEYRDQLQEIYGNQFRSRQATTYVEFPFSNKFGEVLWFGQNASLMIEGERIIGFQVIARDISERKRAEEALRESEEKYRDLVENINDILYATDEHGIVTYIAPAIESLSGYTTSEIMGHSFFEFVYEDDISSMKDKFQQDMSGQAEPRECRMMTKSGDIRWARTSSRPFFEGDRIVGLRGILTDITERKQAEEEIKRGYEQLQETLHSTVKALASTVEMKDQYTAGHQPRVTQLACAIAEEMGLSEAQIEGIRMAASIHDIGKIMVPAEILNKPGPLSEIQYEMIKMHPRSGYDILKGLKLPWPVAQIILQHHERQDGSGYPQGLSGEEIMVEARILAVANVVEAMNAHRPYRPAYDIKEALAEISKNRGTFYDATVVDACLRLFTEKGFTLAPVPR